MRSHAPVGASSSTQLLRELSVSLPAPFPHSPLAVRKVQRQAGLLLGSQIRMVPSAEQEARRWEAGLKARPHTASPWPSRTWLSTLGSGHTEGRKRATSGPRAPTLLRPRQPGWGRPLTQLQTQLPHGLQASPLQPASAGCSRSDHGHFWQDFRALEATQNGSFRGQGPTPPFVAHPTIAPGTKQTLGT